MGWSADERCGQRTEPWPGDQQKVQVCCPISCTSQCRLSGVEMPCAGLVFPCSFRS